MHSYLCLVIIAIVSLSAHTWANEAPSESVNAPLALPVPTTPKQLCKETVCPRLYMPVCGLVDGEQVTAPSRCVLNNKIRCSSALQRSLGKKVPRVRFLHSGPCSAKADKSTVLRKRRDMLIDSNEEIIAVESSEGEYDVSKVEDDGNNVESVHVEIHDSGESGESGEFNAIQYHNVHELEDLENQVDLDDKEAEADDAEVERDHAIELKDSEED